MTDTPEPKDHRHIWKFAYTSENFFDGDETDVYKCSVEGCKEYKEKYIPR